MESTITVPKTKGYLSLQKITPVIEIFFGLYQLQQERTETGKLVFYCDTAKPQWDELKQRLIQYMLPYYQVKDIESKDFPYLLTLISERFLSWFKINKAKERRQYFSELLEHFTFTGDVDIGSAFLLAQYFDDGHGLQKMELEQIDNYSDADNPLAMEYQSLFASSQIVLDRKTDGIALGQILHDCLTDKMVLDVARIIALEAEQILCSIVDQNLREAIRVQLVLCLSSSVIDDLESKVLH